MKELKYYLDNEYKILSVYNKETDFFAQYSQKKGMWEMSKISFIEFKHSYNYKLINEDEALKICNGNLPLNLFAHYVECIKSNRNFH